MKYPTIKEVSAALIRAKRHIGDDCRASEEDDGPGIQVTLGVDPESGEWALQLGDNSYTGSVYGLPYWGVGSLYRRSNSRDLARDLIEEIEYQVF